MSARNRDLIDLLDELLSRRAETRNCDYKAAMPWPGKGNLRNGLIKDMLAFGNPADGGWIVFGVRDDNYEPVGLGSGDVETFDQSKIHEALASHASPVPTFELHKVNRNGTLFVLIRVHEFAEVPAICTKDVQVAKAPRDPHRELVLRNGAIYIRTAGAQSIEIRDEGAMRELLGRAVRRTRETFLIQLERVLAGRQQPTLASAGAYDRNIAAFLDTVSNSAPMSDEWHCEMTIQPFPYITRRVPLDGLLKRITNSTVNLRGWPLPDVGTVERSDDAIGSASDWGQYHERWQFQSSGLFVWAFRLSSDQNPKFKGDLLVRDAL